MFINFFDETGCCNNPFRQKINEWLGCLQQQTQLVFSKSVNRY